MSAKASAWPETSACPSANLGDIGEGLGSILQVASDDKRLVLNEGQEQGVGHHSKLPVDQVDPGLGGQVAEQEHGPIQVEHGGDLPTHAIVQPPCAVVVDEAVPHPQPCIEQAAH